ncbi:hypothetical protein BGZ70_001489 [Mortierella alpina]|uniref:Uncharacterized protein n=1 Tax=Mortierella alpina TaxID=64518 RepID=A0A9P6LWY5_MORAP|nr:hypothetical protein BGZ70_001489 [Mortierella alpina]
MNPAQTSPELAIVCRILQQAAVPIPAPALFDQQWTPSYIRQCFQWTDHLAFMLSLHAAASDPLPDQDSEAVIIIKSYLETQQKGSTQNKESSVALHGPLPSLQELASPTSALRTRLLRNPTLSPIARMEIMRLELQDRDLGSLDQAGISSLRSETMSLVNETAIKSLIAGVQSHFSQLSRLDVMDTTLQVTKDVLLDLSAETIDRKAKASVIFNRVRDHPTPSRCIETVLFKLQEYVDTSRSEAMDVIKYLRVMANSASKKQSSSTGHGEGVNWSAFADQLHTLERD